MIVLLVVSSLSVSSGAFSSDVILDDPPKAGEQLTTWFSAGFSPKKGFASAGLAGIKGFLVLKLCSSSEGKASTNSWTASFGLEGVKPTKSLLADRDREISEGLLEISETIDLASL